MPIRIGQARAAYLLICIVVYMGSTDSRAAEPKSRALLPEVEVIATTPLDIGGLRRDLIAAPLQTAIADDIESSHATGVGDFMNRRLGSVYVNDVQNNPLQPDLNYRGYTASPLLGTPQGLAVYMDGMRLNQPFGDVVSWDSIPQSAIAGIALMPGSNPLFGLNALGGALSIRTKDGRSSPGIGVRADYGSHARRSLTLDYGAQVDGGFDWFLTGHVFRDSGWRDASRSKSNQAFAKLGWHDDLTDVNLTAAYADSNLAGNGMQEQRLLAADYASVYTKPDITENRSALANLQFAHRLTERIMLSGNAYVRDLHSTTFNGDVNESSLDQAVYQPDAIEQTALTAAGYSGFPIGGESAVNTPFPYWRCIANVLLNDEPNEKCNGLINRTHTEQRSLGAAVQLTARQSAAGRDNSFLIGASFDSSRADFMQSTQFGYLTPDRGVAVVEGPGAFADGSQNSEDAFDAQVDLWGDMRTWSAYFSDTLELHDGWHLTLSGRYNYVSVANRDRLTPGGGPGSLDGDHTFSRFNPAIGLTVRPALHINGYVGFNQSSRAPSSIELGCADPDNPCKLPNAMAGDPPLKQVVASTVELGLRSTADARFAWNIGVFRTDNRDDILFVAGNQSGFGHFANFGKTRRQGVELGANRQFGPVALGGNYTYLDATYRSAETVNGGANSVNDEALDGNPGFDGVIEIEPGGRIPLIPQHTLKVFADYIVNSRLSANVEMLAISSTYARGNENNKHRPDGVYYLGPGKTPDYAVFNFGLDCQPTKQLSLFVKIDNLFDKRYYTAAQLGATAFRADGTFIARPFAPPAIDGERPLVHATFYSPGAPRSFVFGLHYRFGDRS